MSILRKAKLLLLGSHKVALEEGLNEGKNCSIMGGINFGSEPYLITLGEHVRLSFGVSLVTHDGGTWAFRDNPKYKDVIKYGKINIKKGTFVGCNSTIMPGVTIGEYCVIGAGSVVTKDIPDGTVAVGVPARVIMTTEEYADKCLRELKPYNIDAYKKNKREYLLKWLNDNEN